MPELYVQNYDPFGNPWLSTGVAALPVLVLLGLLVSGRALAWQAAVAGLVTAWLGAVLAFGMPPLVATACAGYGMVFALFRIIWLITAAVFLYNLSVEAGQFEILKASVANLSPDRRIQAVLVAFSFGALIEGAAGFGAPVAISAALLVGLGFPPLKAAILCLVANTAPVAWGGLGIPIRTLGEITDLPVDALSAMAGRILPPLSVIIPFWIVRLMVSWKQTLAVWPALVTIGGSFAITQAVWANFVGYVLVDIASSIVSLLAGVILLKFWQPASTYHFEDESPAKQDSQKQATTLTAGQIARAWMPFAFLTLSVLIWGLPEIPAIGLPKVSTWLDANTSWKPGMPGLHQMVVKGPEVGGPEVPTLDKSESALLPLVPISATGTAVFIAAILSGAFLGLGPKRQARTFVKTVYSLRWAAVAILTMLGLGFITKYAGLDAVMGLALTNVGRPLYPIFGTLLGWLGVALTGSDTSSNVLFGNLQAITARSLDLPPILMAAANSTGGVMGKMIDAQSIVVAAAATRCYGQETPILRAVMVHSIILALLVGAIVWSYAFLVPGWIPLAGSK